MTTAVMSAPAASAPSTAERRMGPIRNRCDAMEPPELPSILAHHDRRHGWLAGISWRHCSANPIAELHTCQLPICYDRTYVPYEAACLFLP